MINKKLILSGIIALTMSGAALKVSAQVGINTDNPQVQGLHIVQKDKGTNQGHGFILDDGNQADGKVLTSDANGIGTWKLPALKMIEENPFDSKYSIDSIPFVKSRSYITGHSITLPAGKWKVDLEAVLSQATNKPWATPIPAGNWAWIYFQLTDNPAILALTSDIAVAKRYISMIYTALTPIASNNIVQYATTSGFWTVNNTSGVDKTYWVFVRMVLTLEDLPDSYLYRVFSTQRENKLVATPIL